MQVIVLLGKPSSLGGMVRWDDASGEKHFRKSRALCLAQCTPRSTENCFSSSPDWQFKKHHYMQSSLFIYAEESEWCLYDLLLRNVVLWVELVATATDSVTIMVTTHAIVITDGVTRKSHSGREQTASQSAAPLKIFMHYSITEKLTPTSDGNRKPQNSIFTLIYKL